MLPRQAARAAVSRTRRRLVRDADRRHQIIVRPLATRGTRPLRAHPNRYVAGVRPEQLEASQAMQDWYAANFGEWRDEPDKIIVGEDDDDDDDEEEEEEEEENPSIIKLPDHLVERNIRPLVAYLRDPVREEGSRACHRLRNPRVSDPNFPLIPGILYGSDPTRGIRSGDRSARAMLKTPWFEIQRELAKYHWGITGSFENRVYALTVFPGREASLDHHRGRQPRDRAEYRVDSENMTMVKIPAPPRPAPPPRTPVEGMENVLVVPADLQMHPVRGRPFCLNYVRYHPSRIMRVPIRNVNEEESPAIKRGGFLCPVSRFVECTVEEGAPVPEFLGLECAGLRAKDVVRRDRLMVPDGVTIHPRVPDDLLIGTVFGVRGGMAAVDEEEEADEAEK